ncbi:DUF6374 family protein [Nocardia sp. CC227C]|uniref:DUF6374 family protein n=1 Tax=Nocardia sp. CC227C TaxID=3044562 RepID=UPI00278C59C5|nr:DUF6374 family protein [Nocardia sp. CC227C]
MPELSRLDWARMNLDQVRRQLLDAAAFGKYITPEQLEHAAGKIAEGMRIYLEETHPAPTDPAPDRPTFHGRMDEWPG